MSDSDQGSLTTTTSSMELGESTGRVSVSGSEKRPPPELRHRRTSNTNNSNNNSTNHSGTTNSSGKPKKKKRRWRWIVGKPRDLTMEQEQVFMTMKLRKLNRALTGTKTKRTRFEFFALVAYFVLAFGVVSYSSTGSEQEEALEAASGSRRIIVLDLTDIVIMMLYILVVSFVTSVLRESKFITLLYWMFIYLPLAAMIVSFISDEAGDWGGFIGRNPIVAILLITAEMLVLAVFLSLYKIYPKIVQSNWFRRKKRAGTFWRIKVISDWTMTYVGSWGRRFTCKYDGETNADGLPHGLGRWLDDSFAGEVLTGTWINGVPVAPFASRQFGTGDAFKAVRIGYVMASDDEFTTTKFMPTNDKAPRIGMCSVECSISGSFYNELPLATHLMGPHWLDADHTVDKLCRQLTHVETEEEQGHQLVQIKANDPRGVMVNGHVYGNTGESFHPGTEAVVVLVDKDQPDKEEEEERANSTTRHRKMTPRRSLNFMPRASRQTFRQERIIVCDESDDDQSDRNGMALQTVDEEDSQNLDTSMMESPVPKTPPPPPTDLTRVETPIPSTDSASTASIPGPKSFASAFARRAESPVPSTGSGSTPSIPGPRSFASTFARRVETPIPSTGSASTPSVTGPRSFASTFANASRAYYASGTYSSLFGNSHSSHNSDMELGMGMSERTTTISEPIRMANASLRVQDWIPAPHKDALIFFPGYKVPLKNSLEALGQFIAMTRLDSRVYPIIFGWPCGQRFSYLQASKCSATDTNRENLLNLLKGLQAAGVRNVHFMSHSMGVQTMLGAFADTQDGERSEFSNLFRLDPDFIVDDEEAGGHQRTSIDRSLMICRTVTMLNPDFPLEAFVDRAFLSVRRVCSTVTIIGDRHDIALTLSQMFNGMTRYCGYEQPELLQPKPDRELGNYSEREVYTGTYRFLQQVIGLSIESLYFPDDIDREDLADTLLFKERAPVIVCTDEEPVADRAWLDLDVIDTTGLDTNIAGIRHSGFNLNPILLKDLEELISTGRRAVSRATLLYREGNQFSYCFAPSYVAM